MHFDIYKIGGILLKDRKLLVCRVKEKDVFIAPGGRVEEGETPVETLQRELREEISVSVDPSDLEEFGTFFAAASGSEQKVLKMEVFLVKAWTGAIVPDNEVEEIAWIDSKNEKQLKLGSIFEHEVIPRLLEKGLIS